MPQQLAGQTVRYGDDIPVAVIVSTNGFTSGTTSGTSGSRANIRCCRSPGNLSWSLLQPRQRSFFACDKKRQLRLRPVEFSASCTVIVLPPKRSCSPALSLVPVHKFPQPGTDVQPAFQAGFAHSASCAQDGNVPAFRHGVYSRNSKAPCQYYSREHEEELTCRMMNGVKTQFTQQ